MKNVSLLIVSHSLKIAEGIHELLHQMVGDSVKIGFCGGNRANDFKTTPNMVMSEINKVWSEAGVLVLVDLGGAELNSEMAIEMMPDPKRAKLVLCDAPIVEGAIIAANEAAGGADLLSIKKMVEEPP